MLLKSTFWRSKSCTSCASWGEGGLQVIWTIFKRIAVFSRETVPYSTRLQILRSSQRNLSRTILRIFVWNVMYQKIFPSLFQEYLVCDGSSASFRSEFTQVDYRDHSSDDARPSQIVPPGDIQSQGQSTPSTYFVEPSAPK